MKVKLNLKVKIFKNIICKKEWNNKIYNLLFKMILEKTKKIYSF